MALVSKKTGKPSSDMTEELIDEEHYGKSEPKQEVKKMGFTEGLADSLIRMRNSRHSENR